MRNSLRRAALAAAAALALFGAPARAAELFLMPWPQSVAVSNGALPLEKGLEVVWIGHREPRLDRAADRFVVDLRERTGLESSGGGPRLEIRVAAADPGFLTPAAKEAYVLSVSDAGVRIDAQGPAGALHGLATLRQLVFRGPDGFALPILTIEDAPRFAWRGLMIDPARHFVSLETLKRQIDAMEATKLNVLHLHLSDNEGFRVESLRFPRLTEVASHGQHYTQAEIRELVAYAADRGVRIVPEFDVPGHTGALLSAYPELSATPVNASDRIALMSLAMDPSQTQTYDFLAALFSEMAALFPDPYFHVGGDEVSASAWLGNPEIRAFMAEQGLDDAEQLQAHFFDQIHAIVGGLGKTVVGWEEVAAREVDDSVVVQAWRSSQAVDHITAQGNRALLSAGYYLDLLWPGIEHYAVDPLDPLATPPDRAEHVLGPAPTGPLTPGQARLVLGAEAPLWGEVVTDEMLDGRLWPRAALLAERFWSPAEVRDPFDAARRVVVVQELLRIGGLEDAASRRRMAARLAPSDAEAVEVLASATGPVRNFGRLWEVIAAVREGRRPRAPELNTLADAAAPDSVEVHRLTAAVDAYLRGDRSQAAVLRAQLAVYRDNHPRFAKAAEGVAGLEDAIPVSAELAALAQTGLEALEFLEQGRRPDREWRAAAAALLKRQETAAAASGSIPMVWSGAEQPPANLLIIAASPLARLIESAGL